jgi:hypothetical protein
MESYRILPEQSLNSAFNWRLGGLFLIFPEHEISSLVVVLAIIPQRLVLFPSAMFELDARNGPLFQKTDCNLGRQLPRGARKVKATNDGGS